MKSLNDLRAERRVREIALAESVGQDITRISGWSEGAIDPVESDLLACTTDYADSVAALSSDLDAMTADDLAEWFGSIQWEPVGSRKSERISDYMERG
jgi:hypothetical protein